MTLVSYQRMSEDGITAFRKDGSAVFIERGHVLWGDAEKKAGPYVPPSHAETLAQERARIEAARLQAFKREADPLYFEWQAGEGTQEAWQAKRAEIRARLPYPDNTNEG